MAIEYVSAEEAGACVDDEVVSVDIAEPALLLIEVLIDGLAVLVDGDWLAAQGVGLFEVVLAGESIRPAAGHLYLLIDEVDPALHEGHLLLRAQVVQPRHHLVLLELQLGHSIIEEPQQLVPHLRLVAPQRQPLHLKGMLVVIGRRFLQQPEQLAIEMVLYL